MQGYLGGDVFEGGCFFLNMLVELSGQSASICGFCARQYFYTSPKEGIETMRLNHTMTDEETIDNSIKRLSEVINNDFGSRFWKAETI
jgi:hypothetical protein